MGKRKSEDGGDVVQRSTDPVWRAGLKQRVQFALDLQRVRQQVSGRLPETLTGDRKKRHTNVELTPEDMQYLREKVKELLNNEKAAFKDVERHIKDVAVWQGYLRRVKGIGPVSAGYLLSMIRIENCHTASKLHSWCGLGMVKVQRCTSPAKHPGRRNVEVYTNHPECPVIVGKGNPTKGILAPTCGAPLQWSGQWTTQFRRAGQVNTFDGRLRTKLIGVVGGSFLKARSPFADFYYNYKNREEQKVAAGTSTARSKGHIHQRALRYMVKQFLIALYKEWRAIEGLEVRPDYREQYLGGTEHEPIKFVSRVDLAKGRAKGAPEEGPDEDEDWSSDQDIAHEEPDEEAGDE